MPTISVITFDVQLQRNGNSLTVVVHDLSLYPDGAKGIYTITEPDGYVRQGDWNSPDVLSTLDGTTDLYSSIDNLRLSSTNEIQCGTYTFNLQIKTTDNVITSFTRTAVVSFKRPKHSLREEFDVFTPELKYYDDTNYQASNFNLTFTQRGWYVTSSAFSGGIDSSDTSVDIVSSGDYYDATYSISFDTSLEYQHQVYAWLSVTDTVSTSLTTYAETPPTLTEIVQQISALRTLQESLQNSCRPYERVKADFEYAQDLFVHILDKIKWNDMPSIYVDLKELIYVLHNNHIPTYTALNVPIDPYVFDGGAGSIWGTIVGTITLQTDLVNYITTRINASLNGYNLDSLNDVTITTPANNNILIYDSTTSLWKNVAISSVISTAGTLNYLQKAGTGGVFADSRIFDNGSNFGFNTSSPDSAYGSTFANNVKILHGTYLTPGLYVTGSTIGWLFVKLENTSDQNNAGTAIWMYNDKGLGGQMFLTSSNFTNLPSYWGLDALGSLAAPSNIGIVSRFGNIDLITGNIYSSLTKFRLFKNGNIAIGLDPGANNYKLSISADSTNAPDGTLRVNGGKVAFTDYISSSAFPGTVAGLLAFDSSGNIITTSAGSGGGGSSTLAGLTDVALSTVTGGQYLTYNSTTSKWVNTTFSGSGTGDMTKAVYDIDNDGIVDKAETMATKVRNQSGATIYRGTIVYLSGSTGNLPLITKSQANAESTSAGTFGAVVDNIANNADGYVCTIGTLTNLDTRSSATNPFTNDTLVDGDTIYLDPNNAGYITRTKPSAPNHIVYIGKVIRTHPTLGAIVYRIQNGYELSEIHDVSITSPANNDILVYETGTPDLWKNKSIATILGYTPQAAITLTTTGTSGLATFAGNTLNIPNYTLSGLGGVSGTGAANQITYWSTTSGVTGSATLTYAPTAPLLINNSVTASGAIARGFNLTSTLAASANNDVLAALNISPVFTNGAFTNVRNLAIRVTNGDVSLAGSLQIDGNFTVGGTTTTVNAQTLSVADNMIYLNNGSTATITNVSGNGTTVTYTAANNYQIGMTVTITGVNPTAYNLTAVTIASANSTQFTVTNSATGSYVSGGTALAKTNVNPDLGFAGGYNDGTYAHTGLFRDASDSGIFKFFKGYTPEPDASVFIDTTHASFALATVQAATFIGALQGNADTVTNGVYTTGSYANPAWITSLAWTKITGAPSFITLTGLSATAPLSYNNTTGAFTITQATTSTNGYLSSTDWNTFNSKQAALTGTSSQLAAGNGSAVTVGSGLTLSAGTLTASGGGGSSTIVLNRVTILAGAASSDYPLALGDAGEIIEMNVDSAAFATNTVTVPLSTSVAFPVGTQITVTQYGTSITVINPATAGVLIRSATGTYTINARYSAVTLVKMATDEWYLYGGLTQGNAIQTIYAQQNRSALSNTAGWAFPATAVAIGTTITTGAIDTLILPVAAGKFYSFKFVIHYSTTATTTTGAKFGLAGVTASTAANAITTSAIAMAGANAPTRLGYDSYYNSSATVRTTNNGMSAFGLPTGTTQLPATSASTVGNICIIEGVISPLVSGYIYPIGLKGGTGAAYGVLLDSYVQYQILN